MASVYTIIDFETTRSPYGVGYRAVEVALLRVGDGGVEECFAQLVNPECRIDYFSQSIHGITDMQVRGAPVFAEIWPRLRSMIDGTILIAHNAPFDAGVMRDEIRRGKFDAPALHWACSCRLSRRVWPQLGSHKLDSLRRELQLSGVNSHRAEADVRLTAELVERALGELQGRVPEPTPLVHLVKHGSIDLKVSWPFKQVRVGMP